MDGHEVNALYELYDEGLENVLPGFAKEYRP